MSDSEQEDVQQKVTKVFRKNVLKWVELDDSVRQLKAKIKEINEKVKEINHEKEKFEEPIITFLSQVNEDAVMLKDGGKLSKNISKQKAPLKKEFIHKALVELVHDTNKAMTMTDHIINSRPTVEKINLKRIKAREPKK
jgi:seryl-tRNA synthetase